MYNYNRSIILFVFSCVLTSCSNDVDEAKYKQCIAEGIVYYKQIGSYPILTTGERSDHKIKRVCKKNVKMFRLFE